MNDNYVKNNIIAPYKINKYYVGILYKTFWNFVTLQRVVIVLTEFEINLRKLTICATQIYLEYIIINDGPTK